MELAELQMDSVTQMTLTLLSGTGAYASPRVKNSLALIFGIRFLVVIINTFTIWKDDLLDLQCNSTRVGCRHQCYTEFSPLSPFTLFTLQLVFIFTLSMANYLYNSLYASEGREWKTGFINMLAKILIEGFFLFLHHMLYPNILRPHMFECHITPCEKTVVCVMLKSQQKDVFVMFMYTCSFASLLLGVREIYSSVAKHTFKTYI
ncbi:gap junction beta-5 protein-like [Chiloscyllium plagiosum]|uniref:gap junction beta-5 protein-like n=1 Tax=Chiloscyllium plagiosum TaxID=36176 RepID=UPI001CB833AC|nr:gap junction beta-5 protein-like [Chiloscyllium plagiosum]